MKYYNSYSAIKRQKYEKMPLTSKSKEHQLKQSSEILQNNSMTTIKRKNTTKEINVIKGAGRKSTTKRSYIKSTVQRSTKSNVHLK